MRDIARPGALGEEAQQVELLGGELDDACRRRAPRGGRRRSSPGPACTTSGGGRAVDPAQHRLDPRHELGRRERLREVVVGAELEPEDPVDLAVARGEEDDRAPATSGGCRLHTSRPSMSGRPTSRTTRRGRWSANGLEPAVARGGLQDPEALSFQVHADEVGDVGLVVDDDDRAPFHMPAILTRYHAERVDGPCEGCVMPGPAVGETPQAGRGLPRYPRRGGPTVPGVTGRRPVDWTGVARRRRSRSARPRPGCSPLAS